MSEQQKRHEKVVSREEKFAFLMKSEFLHIAQPLL